MGDQLIIGSVATWARAVCALPSAGALPLRTVLVPGERHAHALRRELVRSGRQDVLAGTRFVGAVTLAIEILRAAGVELEPGEDQLRPARLAGLLHEDLALEYFELALVRRGGGWADAFASAIAALERAGLTPDRIPATTPQWRDLATLWNRLDTAAGSSWTAARVLREAAARLRSGAKFAGGPVLAAVTGHERVVLAEFVGAIPGAVVAFVAARPGRERHQERITGLFPGRCFDSGSLREPTLGTNGGAFLPKSPTELELLQRFLFSNPETLADPRRERSQGHDGTVEMEEHAGVEEELEAAVAWVAREILERKTPLERMAVLVPVRDPLAELAAARLARLPWKGGTLPLHVAGGLPITATAGGARVLAVVRALSTWLSAGALASVLPGLRAQDGDRDHLTHGEAMELAWSLGTVGGNGANPAGALEWSARAAVREQELATVLAEAAADANGDGRHAWHVEHALGSLRAARPALDALVSVTRLLVDDAPLSELGPAVAALVRDFVIEPVDGAPVKPRLCEAFTETARSAIGATLRGQDALAVLGSIVLSQRVPVGRFGEPAVFVGAVADATGLDFDAVRILGLCEGTIPPAVREDPVLPDAMRTEAHPKHLVATSIDRVLQHLHAFDRVVRDTRQRLVLSAPRVNLERTEREPSSLFIEVGAALGRSDGSGPSESVIPDLQTLRRDAFVPARTSATSFRTEQPVGHAAWLDRASSSLQIPPAWSADDRFDLSRIEALRDPRPLDLSDGILCPGAPLPVLPGVTPEKPISASALGTLLGCPRRFLYERILKWSDPAAARALREIEQPTYGSLFHEAMEDFYRENGPAFVAHEETLAHWQKIAADHADRAFAESLSSYPLVGDGLRNKELERLRTDVRSLLQYDWDLPGKRTFVDVERAFGEPTPIALKADGRTLYLRGYIDRLDREDDHTLVRDLKTGNAHPRVGDEAGISVDRDLQLAVYGIVVKELAPEWELPAKIQVAYVYPRHRGDAERAFRHDFGELEEAGREWLAVAAKLLHERLFPATPVEEDCTYCSMRPICGSETPRRAAEVLAGADGALGAFYEMKVEDEDE